MSSTCTQSHLCIASSIYLSIYIYIYLSLYISIFIYIYIYTYTHIYDKSYQILKCIYGVRTWCWPLCFKSTCRKFLTLCIWRKYDETAYLFILQWLDSEIFRHCEDKAFYLNVEGQCVLHQNSVTTSFMSTLWDKIFCSNVTWDSILMNCDLMIYSVCLNS